MVFVITAQTKKDSQGAHTDFHSFRVYGERHPAR